MWAPRSKCFSLFISKESCLDDEVGCILLVSSITSESFNLSYPLLQCSLSCNMKDIMETFNLDPFLQNVWLWVSAPVPMFCWKKPLWWWMIHPSCSCSKLPPTIHKIYFISPPQEVPCVHLLIVDQYISLINVLFCSGSHLLYKWTQGNFSSLSSGSLY